MIKKEKLFLLEFISVLALIFIYTRTVINIEILTNNKELHRVIENSLEKSSIEKYTLIKNEKELSKIKENILQENKDKLEWINIERKGMKYIINIEQKIEKNRQEKEPYCNIISLKDAIITKIITSNGMELKDINDSVKKNEIIISGDIKYNEDTKKQVCATGTVYGKTWYTLNISLPKNYEVTERLNKKRNNLLIKYNNKKYKIFKSRLESFEEENKKIINFFGIELYIQKEHEVKIKTKEYSDKELEEILQKLVKEKMNKILEGEHQILEQKVLKKNDKDSTIDIEIFIVAEEQISAISYDQPISDIKEE